MIINSQLSKGMNRFIDFLGKFSVNGAITTEYPNFGPVNIPDYENFLKKSKEEFFEKWETLKYGKELITLKYKDAHLKDFQKNRLLGSGAFGNVYLVKNSRKGTFHAMKAVHKKTVIDSGQVNNTRTEKLVLQCTNCPFHLRLDYFFKDNSFLYFIIPFIQGGELFYHLQQFGRFDELSVMFYLAQVILALEYLHYLDIVYRDLKPENILLDHTGYIKLADFGFCKLLQRDNQRTYSFCGTMDYLAPEVVLNLGYGKAVDWWAVGVLAYELTAGYPPFREKDGLRKLKRIAEVILRFPDFMSSPLKDLISRTLQKDLSRRYGNLKDGVKDLKDHEWFKPLNWQSVVCRKAKPPFIPEVMGPSDTRHFKELLFKPLVVAKSNEHGEEFLDF